MRFYCIFLCVVLVSALHPDRADAASLQFSTNIPVSLLDKGATDYRDGIMIEAARRVGFELEVGWKPDRRGLVSANAGIDDGHYPRTLEALEDFPDLVVVPVPVFRSEYVAVVQNQDIRVTDWNSLRSYKVGYPMGWVVFENREADFGDAYPVSNFASLIKMLQRGRVDIVLFESNAFERLARLIDVSDLTVLGPPLQYADLFLALNRKHKALVPRFAAVLREMSTDGTLAKLCAICTKTLKLPITK